MSVDGDSSQTQNDETNDNGNNKASTKSVLQLRLYSEVMCIFVLYLVEYRLFACFSLLEWNHKENRIQPEILKIFMFHVKHENKKGEGQCFT